MDWGIELRMLSEDIESDIGKDREKESSLDSEFDAGGMGEMRNGYFIEIEFCVMCIVKMSRLNET